MGRKGATKGRNRKESTPGNEKDAHEKRLRPQKPAGKLARPNRWRKGIGFFPHPITKGRSMPKEGGEARIGKRVIKASGDW